MDVGIRLPVLDRFYYLANFQSVLCALLRRYADLLSEEEEGFIARFGTLPLAARALLVRMAMRKGGLFRASKLNYPEIGETRTAVVPLLHAGWVDATPSLNLDQLQMLLTKAELARCFSVSVRDCRKADLVALLRARYPESKAFHEWVWGTEDCAYQFLVAPLCERFRLMFFGNLHQGWSDFVLADLGVFTYEKIELPRQSRAFRSRAEVDVCQQLQRCSEMLHAGTRPGLVAEAMPPAVLGCDWLEDRRQRLLFDIARCHERAGARDAALAIYTVCGHRPARMREIRLLARGQQWERAHDLCTSALAMPQDEAEREQVRRLLPRLTRKLGRAEPMDSSDARAYAPAGSRLAIPSFELVLDIRAGGRGVEWQVRNSLARQMQDGGTVEYVENGLVNSLFGLLCWRAIFAPIEGAFFHDFHRAPSDLSSRAFCGRRKREFTECLAELESGHYRDTIRQVYTDKMGLQSPFVAWNLVNEALLERALECFPPAHLKRWFEWILRDLPLNRAGFADLVQFWPNEKRYRMIEVKGPGDRLQDNQRRWFEFCLAHDMPVAVCHVRWA